ncbi:MAG: hypothetical protein ABI609_05525 [Acidobacteriota bacterium]
MTFEERFLQELPLIERLIEYTCRRGHCPAQEAEEFAAWAKLRFVGDDYAILRKFAQKSALSTYLSVVLQRLLLDFRIEHWGKWRPSAEARRMGPLALRVEELMSRDGLGLEETIRTLTVGRPNPPLRSEIEHAAERLPLRVRRRFESDERLAEAESSEPWPDALVEGRERAAVWRQAEEALEEATAGLSSEDRLLLKLRFWQGLTISEVATLLKRDAKPLYRRYERIMKTLREDLESRGVSSKDTADLFASKELSVGVNISSVSVDTP